MKMKTRKKLREKSAPKGSVIDLDGLKKRSSAFSAGDVERRARRDGTKKMLRAELDEIFKGEPDAQVGRLCDAMWRKSCSVELIPQDVATAKDMLELVKALPDPVPDTGERGRSRSRSPRTAAEGPVALCTHLAADVLVRRSRRSWRACSGQDSGSFFGERL